MEVSMNSQKEHMRRCFAGLDNVAVLGYVLDPDVVSIWKAEALEVLFERGYLNEPQYKKAVDMYTKQDARKEVKDVHGEKFLNELEREFNLGTNNQQEEEFEGSDESEEGRPEPTVRERLFNVLSSNITFWLAGFVDGIIAVLVYQYFTGA